MSMTIAESQVRKKDLLDQSFQQPESITGNETAITGNDAIIINLQSVQKRHHARQNLFSVR